MPADLNRISVEANGIDFSVLVAGEGDRLALCLHGCPEIGYSWRYQLPVLAGAGYRAWAPDLRGYGATSKPPDREDYRIETLMDDVEALIAAAGPEDVTLIAHDWGAIIGWYVAMHRPQLVDRLVIMNLPHPAVAARVMRSSLRQQLRSAYMAWFQLPRLPEWRFRRNNAEKIARSFTDMAVHQDRFSAEVLDVYRQAALEPGALKAMMDYYRAYVRGGGMRRMTKLGYPPVQCPTLVIWGEQDTALGVEMLDGTNDHVEDLTIRRLPDASHWVQQDDPDTVNQMLIEWLNGDDVATSEQLSR